MSKWPPVLTHIGGFAAVLSVAGIFVAPCGPGCEWPVFAATLLYSLLVLAFRFKVRASRYTAIVLTVISVAFLCESRRTQNRFRQKLKERVQELQAQAIGSGKRTKQTTEQTLAGEVLKAAPEE